MYFFTFLFNTIRNLLNDAHNPRYFLPDLLEAVDDPNQPGKKLFPLQAENWDVGAISGETGVYVADLFADQWAQFLEWDKGHLFMEEHQAIADPANPFPSLSFPSVAIAGLQNLFVLGNPNVEATSEEYQLAFTLQYDYYQGENGLPKKPCLTLQGRYALRQMLCTADKNDKTPITSDGAESITILGQGPFTAQIVGAFVDIGLTIFIKQQAVQVEITSITLRGATASTLPTVAINDLQVDSDLSSFLEGVWSEMAIEALNSPEAQKSLIDQLNANLNKPETRSGLSNLFTNLLNMAVDDMLGPTPQEFVLPKPDQLGEGISNSVNVYLYQRTQAALNNPGSDLYLPKIICASQDPQLEPFSLDAVDIPDQEIMNIKFTKNQLKDLRLVGIVNASFKTEESRFNQVVVDNALLSSLKGTIMLGEQQAQLDSCCGKPIPPPPVLGSACFSLTPNGMEALTGAIKINLQVVRLVFELTIEGEAVDDLKIVFTDLWMDVSPDLLVISLELVSAIKSIVNKILNSRDSKKMIIDYVNSALKDNLAAISQNASLAAQKGFAARFRG